MKDEYYKTIAEELGRIYSTEGKEWEDFVSYLKTLDKSELNKVRDIYTKAAKDRPAFWKKPSREKTFL